MSEILAYAWFYFIYIPLNTINKFFDFMEGGEFFYQNINDNMSERALQMWYWSNAGPYLTTTIHLLLVIILLIVILFIIVLHKQRKTQKMLRDLQSKLDKLQPPDPTEDKTTEDTESAE